MDLGPLDLDCSACTESLKIDRGCEKDSLIPDRWRMDGVSFQRCPKKQVSLETYEYIRAYNKYQKGFLPNSGGWLEQPAKLNDVFDIIEKQLAIIEKKEMDKIKK